MAIALIQPADPVETLKAVKKFAPQVGKIKIPFGGIIVLKQIQELTDEALEGQINRKIKTKKHAKKEDNQRVVKVVDAIECLDEHLSNAKSIITAAKAILSAVLDPGGFGGTLDLVDEPAQCIRGKVLSQGSTWRKNILIRKHRPSRGHGHGFPH